MHLHIVLAITMVLGLALAPPPASAAPLDGSVPILCAVTEVHDCVANGGCERNPLLPVDTFWKVNLRERLVSNLDGRRTSPIGNVQRENGLLLLQGVQNARVWGFVVDEQTGALSVTITDADGALVASGACTAP